MTRVSNPDLHVHSDDIIEIEYEAVDRMSRAPTAVKLINTRVNFQWWVKSNETAKDGNEGLGGWKATNGRATDSLGLATYTGRLSADQMAAVIAGRPARFTVAMNTSQTPSVDMGEKWMQSRSLSHAHTGLENPATNTMANNDLGPIYITWQTHSLVLGVYRETDDVEGYTNYQSRVPGGDHRPVSSVGRGMKVEFLAEDSRGRDKPYKYDRNGCKPNSKPDSVEVNRTFPASGLITVSCLPRNDEFTIKFTPDTASAPNRVEVGIVAEKLRGYLEPYNRSDMTVGGSTVGTFGDGSGGVPEVRICLSSDESLSQEKATSDEHCATWAYQWTTGSVIGAVKRGSDRVSGHRIFIDPTTDNHGAKLDSAKSSSSKDYEIDGLRDGVYDITAHSTRTHKIRGDSVHEVFFYHDEKTDDKDTATKYVGTAVQDTANWTVQRLGLRLMGYIGHDGNEDKKFRGDETVAGISVSLTGSGISRMTTSTDEHGFYRFDDLPEGTYTISASQGSYRVFRGYLIRGTSRIAQTSWSARAQENYPSSAKPKEGTVSLPFVSNYTRRSVTNDDPQYCNDDKTKCGTLYNFGLLYRDGEIETTVDNLSPGTADIKLKFTDVFTGRTEDVRGGFKRSRRDEGDYRVTIDDANWARPRMRGSVPDDDGTTLAPATVTKSLRGKDDFEEIVLHVYDAGASSDDGIRSSRVSAHIHGNGVENFDSSVWWSPAWRKASGTEKTNDPTVFGPISWKSPVVTFAIVDATGAKFEVKKGSTVCASHRCMLDDWNTGHSREGEARENTITVTVTAPNNYDDHEYGMKVTRAAPVGNELTREHFRRVDVVDGEEEEPDHALGDGDGKTVARAFTLETKNPTDRSMNMRIDLMELGVPGERNEYCAQRVVMVKEYNDDDEDALDALNPADDEDKYEDDVCRDTRYRLERDKLYEIEIESEDSVDETYYLNTRNRDRSGDAELESLEIDGDAVTLVSGDTTYSFVEAAEQVTVEWETADENAVVRVRPSDADRNEDGHQFNLGDPDEVDTLEIRVISEDKKDTLHYLLDIRRANNVATLATLTGVTLDPVFAPATTSYEADVAHDVASVTLNFTQTDTRGSTNPTSPHTVALGAPGSDTTVSIVSTAEDESTSMKYTITVKRAAPSGDDATLKALALTGVDLNVTFDPATTEYTAEVGPSVEDIEVTWATTDDDATTDPASSPHTFDLDDPGDRTTITIEVTAEDGETTEEYTVVVTRVEENDDATLGSLGLTLSDADETVVPLSPAFDPATTEYTADVDMDVEDVIGTWTTGDKYATTDETSGYTLDMDDPGETAKLVITVTASDGETEEEYSITVTRAADATLASLSMDGPGLNETFDAATKAYTADVDHDVDDITLTFAATDDDASTDPASPHPATLEPAGEDTEVAIVVTNGPTEMTYTVTVSRGEAPPDPTAGVVLMEVDSVTPFAEEITEGETDTIQVTLAVEPSADSTVTVTITAGTGLTPTPASMTFTSANWEDEQGLVVEAASDEDAEENDPVDLIFQMAGDSATGYISNEKTVDTVEVAIDETDTKDVTVSATGKQIREGASGTYTLVLTSQPTGDVIVELSGAPSDVTVTDQLTFSTTNWNETQTVTINTADAADDENDGNETFTLSHTLAGGGYGGVEVDDVGATVMDSSAAQVVITTTEVTVDEGLTFAYNIALTQAPSTGETVTVDLVYSTRDFTASANSAELTSTNWEAGVAITITARNVDKDELGKTIEHDVSVADTDTSTGSETVYPVDTTASSITVAVKNVPDDS